MMYAYEFIGLFIFFWWAFASLISLTPLWTKPRRAQTLGFVGALVVVLGFGHSTFALFTVASLAPFGAVFPALLVRNLRRWRGADVRDFSTMEIAALFILYTALIFASAGRIDMDPYTLGYAPLSGGLIALAVMMYFLVTRRYFLATAALLGQFFWAFDVGSTNVFDHLGHGLLMPILFVMLVRRILGGMYQLLRQR